MRSLVSASSVLFFFFSISWKSNKFFNFSAFKSTAWILDFGLCPKFKERHQVSEAVSAPKAIQWECPYPLTGESGLTVTSGLQQPFILLGGPGPWLNLDSWLLELCYLMSQGWSFNFVAKSCTKLFSPFRFIFTQLAVWLCLDWNFRLKMPLDTNNLVLDGFCIKTWSSTQGKFRSLASLFSVQFFFIVRLCL